MQIIPGVDFTNCTLLFFMHVYEVGLYYPLSGISSILLQNKPYLNTVTQ